VLEFDETDKFEHKSSRQSGRLAAGYRGSFPFVPLPPQRAELFLERLANLDATDGKKVRSFTKRFQEMLPKALLSPGPDGIELSEALPDAAPDDSGTRREAKATGVRSFEIHDFRDGIFPWGQIQLGLREAWREPRPLLKETRLMLLAGDYAKEYVEGPMVTTVVGAMMPWWDPTMRKNLAQDGQPGIFGILPDSFLQALLHALKHSHLLRYCANPACKEPYFVARRYSQVFCGPACAVVSQRESKLKWWREYGEAARRKRLRRRKGGKHAKAKKA
jgi:hypothetical protein